MHLRIAYTQPVTVELMDVSGLCDLNKQKVEELLYLLVLFGVLGVKDGLDRTGRKNRLKIACIGMWPRMHFLDLQQWTTGLTAV